VWSSNIAVIDLGLCEEDGLNLQMLVLAQMFNRIPNFQFSIGKPSSANLY
jgi:hypothetical protein